MIIYALYACSLSYPHLFSCCWPARMSDVVQHTEIIFMSTLCLALQAEFYFTQVLIWIEDGTKFIEESIDRIYNPIIPYLDLKVRFKFLSLKNCSHKFANISRCYSSNLKIFNYVH